MATYKATERVIANPVQDESFISAINWPAIFAGAFAAAAITLILGLSGSGLGFAALSPYNLKFSLTLVSGGVFAWLIITQWVSSAIGGYITGRLRTRWTNADREEVFFRDTAHGFLTWTVATLLVSTFFALSTLVLTYGALQDNSSLDERNTSNNYYIDSLYRSTQNRAAISKETRDETAIILARGLAEGTVSSTDTNYLAHLVAVNTGVSESEAIRWVEDVIGRAKEAANKARKAAATLSIVMALAMVVGAFIGSVSAVCGGKNRDEY